MENVRITRRLNKIIHQGLVHLLWLTSMRESSTEDLKRYADIDTHWYYFHPIERKLRNGTQFNSNIVGGDIIVVLSINFMLHADVSHSSSICYSSTF